jgi:thermolabile hemolysin
LLLSVIWERAATAAPFSSLFVFGDSLSDVGNISQATFGTTPGQYYSNGRFSNGPVYAESLATGLGLPTLARSTTGGNDFAYGGAQTTGTGGFEGLFIRDIDEQVTQFLSSRTANATSLFLIFAGANDLIGGQTNMTVPINSLANSINRLVTAGARQFLVFNLPPLGSTPRYNGNPTTRDQYNTRAQQFNSSLATMLGGVQAGNPAVTV